MTPLTMVPDLLRLADDPMPTIDDAIDTRRAVPDIRRTSKRTYGTKNSLTSMEPRNLNTRTPHLRQQRTTRMKTWKRNLHKW